VEGQYVVVGKAAKATHKLLAVSASLTNFSERR